MTNYQFIDLSYLNLMSDNDTDTKRTLLDMIINELPSELNKMNTCIQAADYDQLRQISHKLKSTLSFVGNEQVIHDNKIIEQIALWKKDVQHLPGLMESLEGLCHPIIEELKIELNNI